MSTLYVHTRKSSWNPNFNTHSLIGGSMPAPPPVLSPSFHHHHFILLSFPQREIRHTLQKFCFLFSSNISLKFYNFPLHKSGIVCSHNNRYWIWGSYTQYSVTSWCKIWDLLNPGWEKCYWPSILCGNMWLLEICKALSWVSELHSTELL